MPRPRDHYRPYPIKAFFSGGQRQIIGINSLYDALWHLFFGCPVPELVPISSYSEKEHHIQEENSSKTEALATKISWKKITCKVLSSLTFVRFFNYRLYDFNKPVSGSLGGILVKSTEGRHCLVLLRAIQRAPLDVTFTTFLTTTTTWALFMVNCVHVIQKCQTGHGELPDFHVFAFNVYTPF